MRSSLAAIAMKLIEQVGITSAVTCIMDGL